MMRKLTNIFLPKKSNFYKMLFDQAQVTVEGMDYLHKYMKTKDEKLSERLNESEGVADLKRRVLLDELDKTFITPFDREDIYTLSRAIDDIIDYGDTTAEEMKLFELEAADELYEMTGIILEMTKAICRAVEYLENNKNISNEHALKAKALENQVEKLYRNSLVKLFKNDDIRYILKMREIYRHISNCADKGDLAADVIGHIIIKMN
jgi:uncharacterized protein